MKIIVLLSGGIDSAVALAEALDNGYDCRAVTYYYGQAHRREIDSALAVTQYYGGLPHAVFDLGSAFRPDCPLTGHGEIPAGAEIIDDHDTTMVPGRNLVLLALAISQAEAHGARSVAIGANRDDLLGYPDCRLQFLTAMDEASRLGTLNHVGVWAPHLGRTKAEVIEIGRQLKAPLHLTWSCYRGGDQPCAACAACITNAKAGL